MLMLDVLRFQIIFNLITQSKKKGRPDMLLLLAQPALPDTDLDTCTMPYVRLLHRSLFFFLFSMNQLVLLPVQQQGWVEQWSRASHHSVSVGHKQVVGYY